MRALAVIDGEHYADVVRQALAELPYDVVAALFAGGTEKLRGGEDYGIPLAASLEEGVGSEITECLMRSLEVIQRGDRTPTELRFAKSYILGTLGRDGSSTSTRCSTNE